MHFSTEGEISIGLGLLALLGSDAIMIFPTHLWIGWTMVAAAIAGFLLLVLEHCGLWAMKNGPRHRNCNFWICSARVSDLVFLARTTSEPSEGGLSREESEK
jgi:hypothetical protein